MKLPSKISIVFTLLILLVFGTGGIGIAKCECSGKTSLMLPMERSCCPTESGCMTIKVAQISDYELIQLTDIPQPTVADHETGHWDIWADLKYYHPYAADCRNAALRATEKCGLLARVPLVGSIVLRV